MASDETASGADTSRADGERIRIRQSLSAMRAYLDTLEAQANWNGRAFGVGEAQGMADAAIRLAMQVAKLDAYMRADEDASRGAP